MHIKLLCTASVLAVTLGFASTASAQSLSDTIGAPVIDQMQQFSDGNWINRAINTGDIDGSVNIIGVPNFETSSSISGAVDIGSSFEGGLELTGVDLSDLSVGAVEVDIEIDQHLLANVSIEESTKIGGAIVASTAEIKTVAAGAVNTGHIASAAATSVNETNIGLNVSLSDLTYVDGEVSQAAAATSQTSSEAFSAEGTFASLGNLSVGLNASVSESTSGPALNVYAVNEAFNNADINGSVNILSNGTDLAGISTVAAGAVNTGTTSLGFNGAALNNAINGGN